MKPIQIQSVFGHSSNIRTRKVQSDQACAEVFNDYFKSIYKDHLCCVVPDTCPLHPDIPELFAPSKYLRVFINAKYCVFYAKKYIGTQKMKCNASLGRTRLTGHYSVK